MRFSGAFIPTKRDVPRDAVVISHQLMLRAGMMSQESAGIYTWLPFGLRALQRIEALICQEQERAGAVRLLMPTLQSAELWQESGRFDTYGPEMLRLQDRHQRDFVYGPTNEEMITALLRRYVSGAGAMPRMLYHVQWKFRDEARPRFGVMRCREFLMKDAYSFAQDEDEALQMYEAMFRCYIRSFARLGLYPLAVRAPTGPIGGDLSHEFHILAQTGESGLVYDKAYDKVYANVSDQRESRQGLILSDDAIERIRGVYAATDDMHDGGTCAVAEGDLNKARGIEVGHIFFFGTKYSRAMGLSVQGAGGTFYPQMGSYGIGLSRLVAAVIEANHDENGIIWPLSVAPFQVGLLNVRLGDSSCDDVAGSMYGMLEKAGISVLYDDRGLRAGVQFADMDLLGLPWQVIVGPKTAEKGQVELKWRRDGTRVTVGSEEAVKRILAGAGAVGG
ncbi:MAG: proline--tRNA ligase, partial [Alphaproteobacteria bacterium GM202ARS2]|nr:proline--tRNA ligase [Alphaproteobacteria bacterium GM202ARS2]